jgi:hypothetical protein
MANIVGTTRPAPAPEPFSVPVDYVVAKPVAKLVPPSVVVVVVRVPPAVVVLTA